MTTIRVGVIIGSLASESINRKLAGALMKLAPEGLSFVELKYGELPLYNRDMEKSFPPVATAFKESVQSSDAILFVTPEYNRSIPGPLKNAIDWASRPYGKNAFARKATAVIGASTGKIGTAVGQQHLRSILGFCNAPQMNSPEGYIQFTPGLVDDAGNVSDSSTEEFLRNYMKEFHGFITRVKSVVV